MAELSAAVRDAPASNGAESLAHDHARVACAAWALREGELASLSEHLVWPYLYPEYAPLLCAWCVVTTITGFLLSYAAFVMRVRELSDSQPPAFLVGGSCVSVVMIFLNLTSYGARSVPR